MCVTFWAFFCLIAQEIIIMKKFQIINALIWASTILVFAYLFKGQEYAEYFTLFLILCATITTVFITQLSNKGRKRNC